MGRIGLHVDFLIGFRCFLLELGYFTDLPS